MIPARCAACGKDWKVPAPDRSYVCRACGGSVRAAEAATTGQLGSAPGAGGPPQQEHGAAEPGEDRTKIVACSVCQTVNDVAEAYCKECGNNLAAQLQSARDTLILGRRMFLSNAGLMIAGGALGLLIKAPPTFLAIVGGIAMVNVVGAFRIQREPMFWSILIAILVSLNAALFVPMVLLAGGVTLFTTMWGVMFFWLVAGSWVVVLGASRARQLIADHPDLLRRVSASERAHLRRARPLAFSWKTPVLVVAALGVVWAAWAFIPWSNPSESSTTGEAQSASETPTPVEPTVKHFTEIWNASKHEELKQFLWESDRDRLWRQVKRIFDNLVWTDKLPTLESVEITKVKYDLMRAHFRTRERMVETSWSFGKGRWWLTRLSVP